MPWGRLDGLRALVVGGGSGIGLATATKLARDGATVTIAGRTEAKLDAAAARLADAEGLRLRAARCDTMVATDVERAVEIAAGDADGRLDIAVTVPGGGSFSPVLAYDPDQFSREVDLNIRPVYLLIRYAAAAMTAGGSIVATSSTAAAFSTRGLASYGTGKAAVDALVRIAADELGARRIRVNSVRPGLTRTDSTTGMFASEIVRTTFLAGQPLARHGEADDQAAAIRFLAGPESSWITGQHLAVDGGHTLRSFPDLLAGSTATTS
ncbi:NAD(P)-dependent dehydrogenase, short-chain alcohol dehydrogenase family [Parafrankia irregularis]|uniref:NAD(P)-dependent dehydrogenase, short-chain alcohol dehydrogenase family n=1 Tax=Parafrankia irregularis TaxID=795642 RepID=A0A0S4R0I1_9ACTN|nr:MULTISPECIES: SDR family oxidoreductase [Parafrankia]MBE3201468.1 SDR family oxidoreductase [Parafrankia sp. CH37]CUU60342.1 NAD(P)-dependent dehydrogenase, short-chain alcohol dehydrogenase family [Parafrankia irregularis]